MSKRKDILNQQISMEKTLVEDDGKRLIFRDRFSIGWFIFWLIFTGFGAIVYIVYYYTKAKTYISYKK